MRVASRKLIKALIKALTRKRLRMSLVLDIAARLHYHSIMTQFFIP